MAATVKTVAPPHVPSATVAVVFINPTTVLRAGTPFDNVEPAAPSAGAWMVRWGAGRRRRAGGRLRASRRARSEGTYDETMTSRARRDGQRRAAAAGPESRADRALGALHRSGHRTRGPPVDRSRATELPDLASGMPRATCTPASSSRADSPHTGALHPQPHSARYVVERLPTGVDCCGAKGDSNHLPGPPTCCFDGRGNVQDVRTNLFLQVRWFIALCHGPCAPASEPFDLGCRP